jgi:hypothetical protein
VLRAVSGLKGGAIPACEFGGGLVRALEELEQQAVGIVGGAHRFVGKNELAELLAVAGRGGANGETGELGRLGIGIGVKDTFALPARSVAGAAHSREYASSWTQSAQLGTPAGWRGAGRPEKRVAARSNAPQKK